jgi:hypothetical protein
MERVEIKQMTEDQLERVYPPVRLKQVVLPSLALLMIAAALIYAFSIDFSWLGKLGNWALPTGVLAGGGLYLVIFSLSRYLLHIRSVIELNRMLVQMFREIGWPGILLLSLLAGVGEELLFRVFLQSAVSDWLGWVAGLLFSSLLFGLAHFVSKLYVAVTFAIGLLLGSIYLLTQSALLIMAMHFFYDFCAFTIVVKYPHLLKLQ